jgi:hypothetical protein
VREEVLGDIDVIVNYLRLRELRPGIEKLVKIRDSNAPSPNRYFLCLSWPDELSHSFKSFYANLTQNVSHKKAQKSQNELWNGFIFCDFCLFVARLKVRRRVQPYYPCEVNAMSQISSTNRIRSGMLRSFVCFVSSISMAAL